MTIGLAVTASYNVVIDSGLEATAAPQADGRVSPTAATKSAAESASEILGWARIADAPATQPQKTPEASDHGLLPRATVDGNVDTAGAAPYMTPAVARLARRGGDEVVDVSGGEASLGRV